MACDCVVGLKEEIRALRATNDELLRSIGAAHVAGVKVMVALREEESKNDRLRGDNILLRLDNTRLADKLEDVEEKLAEADAKADMADDDLDMSPGDDEAVYIDLSAVDKQFADDVVRETDKMMLSLGIPPHLLESFTIVLANKLNPDDVVVL